MALNLSNKPGKASNQAKAVFAAGEANVVASLTAPIATYFTVSFFISSQASSLVEHPRKHFSNPI